MYMFGVQTKDTIIWIKDGTMGTYMFNEEFA